MGRCGRILALNRNLYGLNGPPVKAKEAKAMPFAAQRRHQYWSVDIRHIDVAQVGGKVYSITILENYSRAILASGAFATQDLSARVPLYIDTAGEVVKATYGRSRRAGRWSHFALISPRFGLRQQYRECGRAPKS